MRAWQSVTRCESSSASTLAEPRARELPQYKPSTTPERPRRCPTPRYPDVLGALDSRCGRQVEFHDVLAQSSNGLRGCGGKENISIQMDRFKEMKKGPHGLGANGELLELASDHARRRQKCLGRAHVFVSVFVSVRGINFCEVKVCSAPLECRLFVSDAAWNGSHRLRLR